MPFPVESALSGVQRHEQSMWYRRMVSVPDNWLGRHVLLHFGAVDWQATVYLNRRELARHQGGYTAFSVDIGAMLQAGENELLVAVFDPTDIGSQPLGKQRREPEGIFYTAASGIWQTVWLEPVPEAAIDSLAMTPDLPGQALLLTVAGSGTDGQTVEAIARDGETVVGSVSGAVGSELRLPVPDARLWSPEQPFLYDLEVTLRSGDDVVDRVTSYFGMRRIEVARTAAGSGFCSTASSSSSSERSTRASGRTAFTPRRPTRRCASTFRNTKTSASTDPQACQSRAAALVLLGRPARLAGVAGHAVDDGRGAFRRPARGRELRGRADAR